MTIAPDQPAAHRLNNFDTLRILAALAVVLAHSIPLTYGPATLDLLWPASRHQATFGYLAIQVFFIISGYLITGSYLNSARPDSDVAAYAAPSSGRLNYARPDSGVAAHAAPSSGRLNSARPDSGVAAAAAPSSGREVRVLAARRFIRARFLRLVPALIVTLFVLAFILGPILTTLPLPAYFRSTLPYRAAFGLSDHLPGVFTHNPFSSGIDGSLWTLRWEALCYLAVLLLGLTGTLNRLVVTPLYLLILAARLHYGQHASLDLGALFFAGAVLYLWRPPLSLTFGFVALVLWLISLFCSGYPLISDTAGAYLCICLGLAPGLKLPNLAKYGDLSYGVYIFAWPIQQTITLVMGAHANWIVNNLITVPLVLALAYASWHFIESPALALKNRKLFGAA
jgi:peptidoglycan/LPS O-acetylase OafA/YrhL